MKKFILNLLIFLFILFIYMGLNVLVNFIIWKNQKPPLKEATTIIAGDSHP